MRCTNLLRLLERQAPEAPAALSRAYGTLPRELQEERRRAWARVARRFLECGEDRDVVAVRAPGRIALNPHCEHQGAWVPYGTHQREIIGLAAARTDNLITLTNLDGSHRSPLSFTLREEIEAAPEAWRRGWLDYIEAPAVTQRRDALADPKTRRRDRTGSINFVKAAALRLAVDWPAPRRGVDLVIEGGIPVGVGQSSSSALVVVAALAFGELWELPLEPARMAALCGEAEWYVGTRGGAGDHAAMLLASAGGLTSIRFIPPMTVREARPMCLPPGYQILIANSHHQAIKNREERRQFNAGIFAYRFALLYLQEAAQANRQELGLSVDGDEIRFLADVSLERFSPEAIYRLLLTVPEQVCPAELAQRYPERYEASALACFGTTACEELPAEIPIRGAALYGLGRVDRGLAMHDLCARGDEAAMAEFGRLMYTTHDGDRVVRYDPHSRRTSPYASNRESVSDLHLSRLLEVLSNGAPSWEREAALPRHQSGYYGASVPELDRIVDTVAALPEVLGAGLMGAGGGGCVLILARVGEEVHRKVAAALKTHCGKEQGEPVEVEPWLPSAPAGPVDFAAGRAVGAADPASRIPEHAVG